MEYICRTCGAIFEEPESNKLIISLLVRFLVTECPYCKSKQIDLTEKSKLCLTRKQKIEKIENDNQ